jgi:hypothetical protein
MRYYVVAALVALLLLPAVARADGDPASDVLYFTDVFTSFEETSKPLIKSLQDETAIARAQGRPIKVAVIWNKYDLGAVPQLFNKPQTYAKFLAAELAGVLTGPLVIAMPAGFGVYVKEEDKIPSLEKVLAQVPVHADTVDELTQTATAGVHKLRLSLTRPSGDKKAPTARALAMSAKLGKKAKLRFRVSDDSGKARALVRVYGAQYALYASLTMPLRKVGKRGSLQAVSWLVPRAVGAGKFRFCVLATDQAGNASKTSCAKLLLKK